MTFGGGYGKKKDTRESCSAGERGTGKEACRLDKVDNRLTKVEIELTEVKADVRFTKNTVVKIEHDHGQKLEALFNGYKLTGEKLDRIEQEVTNHELILKRFK